MNPVNQTKLDFLNYILWVCLSLSSLLISSQSFENDFEKVVIAIDGEAVYSVHDMVQDHQGYIWMSTNLGLIRFDGIDAELMDPNTSDSSDDSIGSLYVDNVGKLWIGAWSGLRTYDPECRCFYQFPKLFGNLDLTDIRSIVEDKNQNIWIATGRGVIAKFNSEQNSFSRILDQSTDPVRVVNNRIDHLLVDQNQNLWIVANPKESSVGEGLIRYHIPTGSTKQFSKKLSDPISEFDGWISKLYEDKNGRILIGTTKSGFHVYDAKNESITRLNNEGRKSGHIYAPYSEDFVYGHLPNVNIIHQDQNGGYWIGTEGKGINYFGQNDGTFKNYNFNLVNPEVITSILEDRQGTIWIGGTMGAGLFKTDLFSLKHQLNTDFRNVGRVLQSPYDSDILWICSQQYGLRKMNLKTKETRSYLHDEKKPQSIGHTWVRSMYQENENTLWVGLGVGGAYGGHDGYGGIGRMDIESGTFTNYKLTRNDDGKEGFSYSVYSIYEDKEGRLWLGAGPGGIFRSDKKKKVFKHFKIYQDADQSKNAFFNIARIDSNGDIWASDFSGEGTLFKYDWQDNRFKSYMNGIKMYNLLIDEKGWLLISSWEKGLFHVNPVDRSYVQYTKKDGLPSNTGLDIAKGDKGIYWVNTRVGPAKFDSNTGKFSSVDLPRNRYNTGIFITTDNRIFLGSNKGLSSFYISQVGGNPFPPQIAIHELMISEQNILADSTYADEMILKHHQNDIAIKYIGLHFSDPEKNQYQYRLRPLDDKWVNAGTERSVRFANLSPGTYSFEVMAANSFGVWVDQPETLQFTIRPPWWATWWAYAIYILAFILITERVYRFQLARKMADSESKRLKEVNEFKNTLFTNITHEFRTPLTVIKGMTESVKSKISKQQKPELDTPLEMIERNSDSLLHLVNEMLDLAKLESGNLELQLVQTDIIPFIKYLGESFHSLAEENQIDLTIYSEVDSLVMDFDTDKMTAIISNLLSNAIKFTPEFGKVIVHINCVLQNEKEFLFLKIKDNGIGISDEELPNIFNRFYQTDSSSIRKNEGTGIGLALTKELVELMGGTIKAKSTPDKGSEFSILIPVTRKANSDKGIKIDQRPENYLSKPLVNIDPIVMDTDSELPLVLIIEDNLDVAHYLQTCLADKYELIHAVNGSVGIEMAFDKIPDIIISDVMMPEKDGFEVCATLKSDARTDHIPIIILTAKVTVEDRLTGLSHGADAYLAKPFNKEELYTRLNQLVLQRKKLIGKIQKDGYKTLFKRKSKNPKLQFLQKINDIVHKDISNSNLGAEDLAKELHISESQLYRKIKAISGKSTAVFIRSIRLQHARELLLENDKSVSEVAYMVGFNDPSWFSRIYKEEFGFSPSSTTH